MKILKKILKIVGIEFLLDKQILQKIFWNTVLFIPLAIKGIHILITNKDIECCNGLNLYLIGFVSIVVSYIFYTQIGYISLITLLFIPCSYLVSVAENKLEEQQKEINLNAQYEVNNERNVINELFRND